MVALALTSPVMPPKAADTTQITIRVPSVWLSRADKIASTLSLQGLDISRTDAFRHALALGLDAVEKQHGLSEPEPKAPKKKPLQLTK